MGARRHRADGGPHERYWRDSEIVVLEEMVHLGATARDAAEVLRRNRQGVASKAKSLGIPFCPTEARLQENRIVGPTTRRLGMDYHPAWKGRSKWAALTLGHGLEQGPA
jgi:hypothetical protein